MALFFHLFLISLVQIFVLCMLSVPFRTGIFNVVLLLDRGLSFVCLIVILLLNLLPLPNLSYLIFPLLGIIFTYFFSFLPLLFLLFWHYVSLWRLIQFNLSYTIDKASFSCLFADIHLPHFIVTLWMLIILIELVLGALILIVFCQH